MPGTRKMPRPTSGAEGFFKDVLPSDPRIRVKPMFGNIAAFVDETMFAGVFGDDVFLRLPEAQRNELRDGAGASTFEPMPGRPMKEYVCLPAEWRDDQSRARDWMERSLEWAATLPVKKPARKGQSKRMSEPLGVEEEDAVLEASEESFPASDPPAWAAHHHPSRDE